MIPNLSILHCGYRHVCILKPWWTQPEPPGTQHVPKSEQVEYSSRLIHLCWVHVGHVEFMLFVSFLFALGTQRKPSFWLEYGLKSKVGVAMSLILPETLIID